MAHPHLYSLIYMWPLQNSTEGLIICHSYWSLGSYDMSLLIMLEGKHYTYEGASLAYNI